ncbi:MAG: GH3 auxin-responsive promoter family protein [Dehalococcoidales bacterium]
MSTARELIRQGNKKEIWQKHCGFIDFSVDEFVETQSHLLLEQLRLVGDCELGHKLLWGTKPSSVEEFRQNVPLTTYRDYFPYLPEKREDALPEKPILWQRTSGRSGEYPCKWVPVTERLYKEVGFYVVAMLAFSSAKRRGQFIIRDHDKLLYGLAPPPYASGAMGGLLDDEFSFDVMPPKDKAEQMDFIERIREGYSLALTEGLDVVFSISSIMVAIGEQFSQGASTSLSSMRSRPRAAPRLAKALVKSKLAGRPPLPRDVWNLKSLLTAGMDTSILREKLKHYWGRYPFEMYASTEMLMAALQTWDYKDMIFVPTIGFYEFISEEEHQKAKMYRSYRPRTLLLNEVEAGQRYEIVFTSLQGGPFVRYRIGDWLEITALRNEELNINLPQVTFYGRCDDILDIGGFTRLTEKTLWQAIENSGVGYNGWTVRKEVNGSEPILHIYIELKRQGKTAEEAKIAVHQSLKEINTDWADLEQMLGWQPLEVTLLPEGAFGRYMLEKQAAGADLAHLKPPQMNASDDTIENLLRIPLSKAGGGSEY